MGSAANIFAHSVIVPATSALGLGADEATAIVIITGSGAPADNSEPNGSIYLRTDGTNGDDSLYMRIAGAWFAMKCETA
jgi:hypothetical protein